MWDDSDPTYKDRNSDPFNVRLIRYADVLLMYAEACLLSGTDLGAGLDALNRVRARAGMAATAVLDELTIIEERDYEFMGEPFRFFDIIRWSRSPEWFDNINFSGKVAPSYGFKENFLRFTTTDRNIPYRIMYMPIPLTEINKNGGALKQNPGW